MEPENELKPCPICGVPPHIGYACGEYYIAGSRPECPYCGNDFSEMHTNMQMEIDAWNMRAADSAVRIPLTMEQWDTVLHWLTYGGDYHRAKMQEWLHNCVDVKTARAKAAEHHKAATVADNLRKIIEETLRPTPKPETE